MIRASARKPVSERSRRSTSGLMSRTATLIARNEPPQMSARVIRAAYGRRRRLESDTGLPLVGGEHERDRAVVFDTYPHYCSKAACPGLYSARAKLLHERLVELLGACRVACLQQARPAAPSHVREQRELRHDQRLAVHVDQAEVHLPGLVGEHAEIDDLVRQAPHRAFFVITGCTHQQHETVADGCTLLRSAFLPTHRAGGDTLRDDSQLTITSADGRPGSSRPTPHGSFQTPPRVAGHLAGGGPAGEDRVLTRAFGRVLTLGRVYPGRHPAIYSKRLPSSRPTPGRGSRGGGPQPSPVP